MTREVQIEFEPDALIISGTELPDDRRARLFFDTVLYATRTENGWRCPKRRETLDTILLRIVRWLERNGWAVNAIGEAHSVLERESERANSFMRTSGEARALREGLIRVDLTQVHESLERAGWDKIARSLRPHQESGLIHALTVRNAANFSVPGAGKTVTALATFAVLRDRSEVDLMLVVGPLSSFGPWETETAASLPSGVRAHRVRGAAVSRRTEYGQAEAGDVLLTSYATAASDLTYLIELCRAHPTMLVVDESHRVKRFQGGVWGRALVQLAPHARYRFVLSGTPMPQGGRDLYSQLNILWPGRELTGNPTDFAARVDGNLPSLIGDVTPFASRTPKAALGLTPYVIEHHDAPLTGTQSEIYEMVESRFRQLIDDEPRWRDKIDVLRRARPIRLLQAAANADLLNAADRPFGLPPLRANPTLMERLARVRDDERPAKHQVAIEILRSITSEGGKAVCWSNFIANLDSFAELVTLELGIPTFQIDGRIPASDDPINEERHLSEDEDVTREAIVHEFLTSSGPSVLVTNPASMSESVSLHSACHNAIYLDRTWNCALFLQSIDRIHRLGLPPDVTVQVHVLDATINGRPTVDAVVDAALTAKSERMRELLEGAELLPINLPIDPTVGDEGDPEDLTLLLEYLLGR